MFVLDVLRWADNYDTILNVINDEDTVGWRDVWGRSFRPSEVDDALTELKRRGYITEHRDFSNYYDITVAGRAVFD